MKLFFTVLTCFTLVDISLCFYNDKPCQAKAIFNRSVVCVCTASYCDEITREAVPAGTYNQYTSSEGGARFRKSYYYLRNYVAPINEEESEETCWPTLELDPDTTYQTIEGFGGAITDSASINWENLQDPTLKQQLIDSYYSDKGLEYNMMRVPIGGCDFSTHAYAYNEYPENDTELTNFTLAYEDYTYKLPMIKAAFAKATSQIDIVASAWSPPPWLKSNDGFSGKSNLLKEFFHTYALYHLKFIQAYKAEGIPIWAVTTTNEPADGLLNLAKFNVLGWNSADMGDWIANDLGPLLNGTNVKILAVDDQRFMIPVFFNYIALGNPEAFKYIDGVAVHFYADDITPASILVDTMKDFPDKFVISTEACAGSDTKENPKVDLGSWDRAEHYAKDILEDLNYNLVGWIDWNVCLDKQGGPNWVQNFVDSPVIVSPETGEFYKQPMFYIMGHFSKFIPRGSVRIKATDICCSAPANVWNVAFKTPKNTVVVVLYNKFQNTTTINLKIYNAQAVVQLEPRSISTVELPYGY